MNGRLVYERLLILVYLFSYPISIHYFDLLFICDILFVLYDKIRLN